MPMAGAEATRNAEMKYVRRERVPEQKAKMNECQRGMDVGERKLLGGTDQEVGRDSEAIQQETSDQIPTENITKDIGTESSERISPRGRGKWQRKTPEVQTENPEEDRTKLRRPDGTIGDVGGGVTGVRQMRRECREVERAPERCSRNAVTTYRIWRAQSDNATCKLQQHPRDVRNRKDRDRGSEGNFAKSCEENRRRAPKIAGGANRGLEGSTERDSRLKRSLGDARPKGDRNPEEPEEGREIWPGPGEDVWDFGKDVRDPERPESFSGASLGNRKIQNTIRTSVRGRQGLTTLEQHQRDGSRAGVEFPDGQPCEGEPDRRIPSQSRAPTERIGDEPKRPDQPEGSGRSRKRRRGMSGSGGQAERNQANPMVQNELQKLEGRAEEPRDSGDKMPEVSETTEMEERKCRGIRDPKSRRPEQIKGVRLSSLRLREEWKGGKEVVNDPDRSRSRGRAEDRRRPEISRADGEVARADRSTEGQRPEVVRTEVGGRTEGEPEVIGTESE
ncbi:hypothetical protein DFH06DRAFT_1138576 [Mycena polygramma]|nr:hypothetical protein DFH06DRAFT_1138576 [Mycena polygramma]